MANDEDKLTQRIDELEQIIKTLLGGDGGSSLLGGSGGGLLGGQFQLGNVSKEMQVLAQLLGRKSPLDLLQNPIPQPVGLTPLETTQGQLGFSPQGGSLIGGHTFTGGSPFPLNDLFRAQTANNALTLFTRLAPFIKQAFGEQVNKAKPKEPASASGTT